MGTGHDITAFSNEVAGKLYAPDNGDGVALLLDGPWGSGKTWLWENALRDHPLGNDRTFAYASLLGVENREQLARRLMLYMFQLDSGANNTEKVFKGFKRLAELAGKYVGKELGIELTRSAFGSMDHVAEGTVVCFDDVERAHPSFTVQEILGLVDYLVLTRKCTVLVLCNTDGLRDDVKATWAALVERVFLWRIRMGAFPEAVTKIIARLAHELSASESNELKRIFGETGGNNLRRLRRVGGIVGAIKQRYGSEVPTAMISCLYMVQSDLDAGDVRTLEVYQDSLKLKLMPADFEGAKETYRREAVRRLSFFRSTGSYRFFPEIWQLVVNGHGLEPLARYLGSGPQRQPELLINQVRDGRWQFMGDVELMRWCENAIAVMTAPARDGTSWEEFVDLGAFVHVIDNLLDTTHLADADSAVRATLSYFVDDRDEVFPDTMREFRRREMPTILASWRDFCGEKRRSRRSSEIGRRCLAMLDAGEEFDSHELGDDMALDDWLEVNYELLLPHFASNRMTVFDLLRRLKFNDDPADPDSRVQRTILAAVNDRAGRALVARLLGSIPVSNDETVRAAIANANDDDGAPPKPGGET